jgi:hypothetical protein
MDHRRHVSQECLLCLPRQPCLRRICDARNERSEPSDRSGFTNTYDRLRKRERHRLRTDKLECRATWRIAPRRRVNMCHRYLTTLRSLRTFAI